jgi:hypothetical protein
MTKKKRELVLDSATGLWLEKDVEFEKREKMTLQEWRVYYGLSEFTEEEFLEIAKNYRKWPDA